MTRLAIVGSGIAGLGLAYKLRSSHDLTIYEKNSYAGGHANTIDVNEGGKSIPIDTGFMVFNHATYPNLLELFKELNVVTQKTDMSFSVQRPEIGLEYSGASFNRLFGDRKNLLRPAFWRLLTEIDRFNREAECAIDQGEVQTVCLLEFVRMRRFSEDFLSSYMIPMSGALWSTPPEKMLNFPAITLLRFFSNHGLLAVKDQHQWWTVTGGSKQYVKKILASLPNACRTKSGVTQVKRSARGVLVTAADGSVETYDQVVLACHADDALSLLDQPSDKERELLGAFQYQRNDTLLHTDSAVMPKQRRCWSSWNYRLENSASSTHYWMNSLQSVSEKQNYFVTLNGEHLVGAEHILQRLTYHHPVFDLNALQAQTQLDRLNEESPNSQVFFCGSYFGYGFHEDALNSSVKLAELLQGRVLCR